jgi:hypothetical protein
MRRVLETDLGGGLYRKTQAMIEPVFANTKFNRRIDRFQRRDRSAARSEWRLITATHSLLKPHKHQIAPAAARKGPSQPTDKATPRPGKNHPARRPTRPPHPAAHTRRTLYATAMTSSESSVRSRFDRRIRRAMQRRSPRRDSNPIVVRSASVEFNRRRARLAPEWGVSPVRPTVGYFPITEPAAQLACVLRGSAR